MRRSFLVLFVACVLLVATGLPSFASDDPVEPAQPAGFLQLGSGARAAGMSGAYTASANDLSSVYWNPAGLGAVSSFGFSLSYGNYYGLNLHQGLVTMAIPFGNGNTFGIQAYGLWPPAGAAADIITDYPQLAGTVGDSSTAITLGFGKQLGQHVRLGLATRGFMQDNGADRISGFGIDLGAQFIIPLLFTEEADVNTNGEVQEKKNNMGTLTIGVMARDVISRQYESDGTSHPLMFRPVLGVAYQTPDGVLLVEGDTEFSFTDRIHATWRIGAEIRATDFLTIRAGVDNTYLSLGAGLQHQGFSLDYAYKMGQLAETAPLNASHLVTLGYRF